MGIEKFLFSVVQAPAHVTENVDHVTTYVQNVPIYLLSVSAGFHVRMIFEF